MESVQRIIKYPFISTDKILQTAFNMLDLRLGRDVDKSLNEQFWLLIFGSHH